jgi:hypothetical protein
MDSWHYLRSNKQLRRLLSESLGIDIQGSYTGGDIPDRTRLSLGETFTHDALRDLNRLLRPSTDIVRMISKELMLEPEQVQRFS